MARNYANVSTAIWRDDDFRKLTATGQRMYLLALSQSDISAAGVLALRLPRWAAMAVDTTPADVQAAIDELQASRHVIYDEVAGELLVRSFVKWDAGYGNAKRRPVIIKAAFEVESEAIRCALAVEFERLGVRCDGLCHRHPDGHPKGYPGGYAEDRPEAQNRPAIRETDKQDETDHGSSFSQENRLSHSPSHAPSDGISPSEGVVVTKGPYLEPHSTTHNPQPLPAAPGADAPPTIGQRAKRITDDYHRAEPLSKWPAVNAIVLRALRTERYGDDEIRAALLRLAADNRSVTVDTLRIELGPNASNVVALPMPGRNAAPNGRRPSATDRAVGEAMEVLAHFEALEQAEQARKEITP